MVEPINLPHMLIEPALTNPAQIRGGVGGTRRAEHNAQHVEHVVQIVKDLFW